MRLFSCLPSDSIRGCEGMNDWMKGTRKSERREIGWNSDFWTSKSQVTHITAPAQPHTAPAQPHYSPCPPASDCLSAVYPTLFFHSRGKVNLSHTKFFMFLVSDELVGVYTPLPPTHTQTRGNFHASTCMLIPSLVSFWRFAANLGSLAQLSVACYASIICYVHLLVGRSVCPSHFTFYVDG